MKRTAPIILACALTVSTLFAGERVLSHKDEELRKLENIYSYQLMMPETLLQHIMEKRNTYVLYDLRPTESFERFHVVNAVNLPWRNGSFKNAADGLPSDRDLILIDSNGTVSLVALDYLHGRGITNCFAIEGGMKNWLYEEFLE
jgi:rhodanese-related sulfurtransferase